MIFADRHYTPVKNQGSCGACAAFASAGMMEAVIAKAYEAKSGGKQKQKFGDNLKKLDMSEQYLLDCAYLKWPIETIPGGGKAIEISNLSSKTGTL